MKKDSGGKNGKDGMKITTKRDEERKESKREKEESIDYTSGFSHSDERNIHSFSGFISSKE